MRLNKKIRVKISADFNPYFLFKQLFIALFFFQFDLMSQLGFV